MRKYFLMGIVVSFFSTALLAGDERALEELTKLLNKMESFQASFSQRIHSSTGEKISDTKGEVVIKRPDRFYWKSVNPDPVLVIADGKYLWTYDVDLEQATKQTMDTALKDTPASLLAGSTDKLQHGFEVGMAKPGACKKAQSHCFILKPKQKESTFKNIYIGFDGDKLVEIRMSDPLSQNVYTVFSNVQLNQKDLDMTLFQFVPPKNVDVIRYD